MAPAHNILLTGASGYLGGTLLARRHSANLPTYGKLFALVRTDEQASAVEEYGAEPLNLNLQDESAVREALIRNAITIVFYLIDATTGAKIFSSHAGAPADRELSDADPRLYDIQKSQKSPYPLMQQAVNTNCIIIEQAELHGKEGYYLAASGGVVWKDLYAVIAKALAKRGVVESAVVEEASADALGKMGEALGVPVEFVPVQLGGSCTFTAARGGVIGWKASYAPEHILEAADEEVELILNSLRG